VIQRLMIHSANIVRRTHTLVASKKGFAETTVATAVECRLEPAGDAKSITVLGVGAAEAYRGWFPAGTDLQLQDLVVWTDRTPNLTFTVEGDTGWTARDSATDHHLEVALKLRKVA
jgi:hypothetical protein